MFRKKVISIILIIIISSMPIISFASQANLNNIFDNSKLDKGIIGINYESNINTKVMIKKGDNRYFYNLESGDKYPLQFGNGDYMVAVLEEVQGNKYKVVKSNNINLNINNENSVYLESIKKIDWNENKKSIKKAKELTKDLKTDKEKVITIYNYIVNNIKYDYEKISKVNNNYIPSIDETFIASKGMCYDFSSLFAAMLRSINIPAKLVMGYKNDIEVYHAWNEVYLKDTNEWVTIDTAYDSTRKENGLSYKMIKNNKEYKIEKQY